jgi:predicted component of type VI protein secretion system
MRYLWLGTIVALTFACAGNQSEEAEGMRVLDTALTSRDTLNPSDTLDRARRVVPDSTAVTDTSLTR